MSDLGLCVGVDRSRFAPALSHAARDARALAQALVEREVHARIHTDEAATVSELRSSLELLAAESTTEARVWVSFSGHGMLPRKLQPWPCRLVLHDGLLEGTELLERLAAIPCAELTLLVDACHGASLVSRPMRVFTADGSSEVSAENGKSGYPSASPCVRVVSSAAVGPWAVERSSGETFLSRVLAEAAQEPGIALGLLCTRVAQKLSASERVYASCFEPAAFERPAF